jgi:small subunit ribosomal protein S4e
MAHMKRYLIPEFWPIPKKERKWVVRPRPGPHALRLCMPLQILVKDVLGYAGGSREARKIIRQGKILVDRKQRKDPKFPVGLMDAVEIPELDAHYRMLLSKKGLKLEKAGKEESGRKLCRIRAKKTLKGGAFQIGLHDGRNITLKGKTPYRPGDSLLISLPDQKILKHFSLEKGAEALVTAGANMGISGRIKEIRDRKTMLKQSTVTLEIGKGKSIETLKDYILVGGMK